MKIDITQNTIIEEETLVEMSLTGEICYVEYHDLTTATKKLLQNTNLMKVINYWEAVNKVSVVYEVSPKVGICIDAYYGERYILRKGKQVFVTTYEPIHSVPNTK